jgi:SprT protein
MTARVTHLAILHRHLPDSTAGYVAELLDAREIAVRISRPRRTKLGDHRPPGRGSRQHRISVNADLNPYAFLTTLLHEIAHADVWEACRSRWRRPRPHGREWKSAFGRLLEPVVDASWVPGDVAEALAVSMRNPTATSCTDRGLVLALARYDVGPTTRMRVEDLSSGQTFRVGSGQVFRLGARLRTRYRCIDVSTGAEYRVHGLACAEPVTAIAASTGCGPAADGRYCRRRAGAGRAAARSACSESARGPRQT